MTLILTLIIMLSPMPVTSTTSATAVWMPMVNVPDGLVVCMSEDCPPLPDCANPVVCAAMDCPPPPDCEGGQ